MANIQIKIKNAAQIQRAFSKAPREMGRELTRAISIAIFSIERTAKQLTPVDTGRLRASLGGGTFKGGSYAPGTGIRFKPYYGEIGTNVEYAPFVHEGTRFMKGRPFLKKAVDSNQQKINTTLEQAVQRALNTIGNNT